MAADLDTEKMSEIMGKFENPDSGINAVQLSKDLLDKVQEVIVGKKCSELLRMFRSQIYFFHRYI